MALPIFPTLPGVGYPKKRTLNTKTEMEETNSGMKAGYGVWSYPTRTYTLVFNVLRGGTAFLEWQQLEGFYASVGGRRDVWLYNDTRDNAVVDQNIGVGDGTTRSFQLLRSLGGFVVPVFGPGVITNVKLTGVVTAAYTLSTTGVITFTTAPASGKIITWTGTYYWVCRFDDDSMTFEEFLTSIHKADQISFTTEKL